MPRNSISSSSSNSSNSESSDSIKLISIIVENLSSNVTQEHVNEIFSHFGKIHSSGLRRVKNYAIINYLSKDEADVAISCMNRGQVDGLYINVKYEEPPE